jgi:hypothetical protein
VKQAFKQTNTFASYFITFKFLKMSANKEFMLLFRFEPNFEHQPTEDEMNEMHQSWGAYFGGLAEKGQFVSTSQLGFEGVMVHADTNTHEGMHMSDKQILGGNLIVSVSDMQEAIEIAKASPILHMGGNVEVRSINPM